ncbi:hypothetical protein, partial [Streptomyces buecherae]|uniref:hypothetical protein n=1 Tax=Streptomyces buecherae TaxID=2763006 RepID=UPI001C9B0F03
EGGRGDKPDNRVAQTSPTPSRQHREPRIGRGNRQSRPEATARPTGRPTARPPARATAGRRPQRPPDRDDYSDRLTG